MSPAIWRLFCSDLNVIRFQNGVAIVMSSIHQTTAGYCNVAMTECCYGVSVKAFFYHNAFITMASGSASLGDFEIVTIFKFYISLSIGTNFMIFFASDADMIKLFRITGPMLMVVAGNWIRKFSSIPFMYQLHFVDWGIKISDRKIRACDKTRHCGPFCALYPVKVIHMRY